VSVLFLGFFFCVRYVWASARHACNCVTRHTSLTSGKTNLIIITVDFIHAALHLVSFLRVCRLFMQQRGIIALRWKMEVREMGHLVQIIKVKSAQYLPSERPYCNQYIHHRSHGPLQWQRIEIACRIEYFALDWKKQKDSFHLFKKVNFCFLQLA